MKRAGEAEMVTRFAANVWWLRTQRRITQEELAFRAQLNRSRISEIEGGKQQPGISAVVALAGALEVPVGALFEGVVFKPPIGVPGGFLVSPLDLPRLREALR